MTKKKDPPDYPGDEAILQALAETVRAIRLERGLSEEDANALIEEGARTRDFKQLPRALALVVRQLREENKMTRVQLSSASGLSLRFINNLERGKVADASVTQIVRLALGLKCPITDFVDQVDAMELKLKST
ncbi:MAG: helix-turn-helix domain-containing protein [Candidatus Angelobacter sp.]